MEDSDADDMARMKNYNSDEEMKSADDDESGEDESDQESSEAEDVEMSESSSEKKLSGKKALRAQITQEKEIRAKEAQMR